MSWLWITISATIASSGPGGDVVRSSTDLNPASAPAGVAPCSSFTPLSFMALKRKPLPASLPTNRPGVIFAVVVMCARTSRTVHAEHSDCVAHCASVTFSRSAISATRSPRMSGHWFPATSFLHKSQSQVAVAAADARSLRLYSADGTTPAGVEFPERRRRLSGSAAQGKGEDLFKKLAAILLVIPGLVAATTSASAGASAQWPQFRYGPSRVGFNPDETTLTTGNVGTVVRGWNTRLPAAFNDLIASPVVSGSTIYF